MKKFILTFAAVVFAALAVNAQPRAIGARFGYGIDLSYQHSVGQNMISAELEFPGYVNGINLAATYDWINPGGAVIPWNHKGEWNWYAGVGAGLGFGGKVINGSFVEGWPSVNRTDNELYSQRVSSGSFHFGVVGRIGVEYQFWFPLQLSIDWRPMFGPIFNNEKTRTKYKIDNETVVTRDNDTYFYSDGLYAGAICLGVRYRF